MDFTTQINLLKKQLNVICQHFQFIIVDINGQPFILFSFRNYMNENMKRLFFLTYVINSFSNVILFYSILYLYAIRITRRQNLFFYIEDLLDVVYYFLDFRTYFYGLFLYFVWCIKLFML